MQTCVICRAVCDFEQAGVGLYDRRHDCVAAFAEIDLDEDHEIVVAQLPVKMGQRARFTKMTAIQSGAEVMPPKAAPG